MYFIFASVVTKFDGITDINKRVKLPETEIITDFETLRCVDKISCSLLESEEHTLSLSADNSYMTLRDSHFQVLDVVPPLPCVSADCASNTLGKTGDGEMGGSITGERENAFLDLSGLFGSHLRYFP